MDGSTAIETVLTDAMLVLPDGVTSGSVRIVGQTIAEVAPDAAATARTDGVQDGEYVLPGLVDIHTDHVEKHIWPRSTVEWDHVRAVLAHDAQVIGSGVTTVFDSLCVGDTMSDQARRDMLAPTLDALSYVADHDLCRAEHLVHLRCEVSDEETPGLLEPVIDHPLIRVASLMDHTPGDRQVPDIEAWIEWISRDERKPREEVRAQTMAVIERSADTVARVRPTVVAMAHARGLPLMSHDDARAEHIDMSVAEGTMISEFPTTLDAGHAARAAGMAVIAGAPNYLRGGSQSGNVAVRDLLAADLVDLLASDYVPRSLLDAAFAIAADPELPFDLARTTAMVSSVPARLGGLTDRGAIVAGQRADLIRVRKSGGHVRLLGVWRAGQRVA